MALGTETINADTQACPLGGVRTLMGITNVTDALPTQAEMVTQFGAAASRDTGWFAFIKDNNADTNFFFCATNGVSWYALKMTKGS